VKIPQAPAAPIIYRDRHRRYAVTLR
jgi:hypothetical protein